MPQGAKAERNPLFDGDNGENQSVYTTFPLLVSRRVKDEVCLRQSVGSTLVMLGLPPNGTLSVRPTAEMAKAPGCFVSVERGGRRCAVGSQECDRLARCGTTRRWLLE